MLIWLDADLTGADLTFSVGADLTFPVGANLTRCRFDLYPHYVKSHLDITIQNIFKINCCLTSEGYLEKI